MPETLILHTKVFLSLLHPDLSLSHHFPLPLGNEKARCYSVEDLIGSDCNFDLCKFPKEDEEILPPAELLADYYKKRAALDHEIDKTLAEIQKILGIEIER